MKKLNSLRLFSLIAIITFSSIQAGLRKNSDEDRIVLFDSNKDLISEKDPAVFNPTKKDIENRMAALEKIEGLITPLKDIKNLSEFNSAKKNIEDQIATALEIEQISSKPKMLTEPKSTFQIELEKLEDSLPEFNPRKIIENKPNLSPPRSTPKPSRNLPLRAQPNLPPRPLATNRTLPSPVPNSKAPSTARPNLPQRPQTTNRTLPSPVPNLPKRPGIPSTLGVNLGHQENKRILTPEEKSLEIQNQHPLIKAVIEDNIKKINKIMRKNPSAINLNSSIGKPLHIAVKEENIEMIKFLLEKKADVDSVAFNSKLTPLHLAVKKGSFPIVELLVKWGPTIDCQDGNKLTPLYYALENYPNNQEIIKCLLKNKADINITEQDSKLTFLHKAVQDENESLVDFLIKHGANPNCIDKNGLTPLLYALKNDRENIKIIKKLLDNGANIDFSGSIGAPLHIAVEKENIKMMQYFLDNHANINIQEPKSGYTPLHLAVQKGNFPIVTFLVNRGAIVDCQDGKKLTPLYYALKNYPKNQDIIEYLLKNKANINIAEQGSKLTYLHKAVQDENESLVDFLIKHGANPNCIDKNGLTPLHCALKNDRENIKIIKKLLDNGANVNNAEYKSKSTPLHLAAQKGNFEVVKLLVNRKATIDRKDQNGLTPLQLALENGHKKTSSFFLGEKYPLHRAIIENNIQEVRKILEKNSNLNTAINLTSSIGTPIHIATRIALETKNTNIISLLLEKGANINAISSGFPKENIDATTYLLDHRVDKKDIKAGSQSFTPLHMAAEKGQLPLVQFLIEHHANPNCTDRDGLTPLHHALKNGHKQTSCFLFNKTELTTVGLDGQSPLHYAVKYGLPDIIDLLQPEDSKFIVFKDKNGQTPLHYAVKSGSLEMVNKLLQKIPKTSAPAVSPLDIAGVDINVAPDSALEDPSFFIDAKDISGHTPLHFASRLGYYDIFLTLLGHGATVSTRNNQDWTLLFFDKALPGQKDIAAYLVKKYDVSVNTKNSNYDTALHFAVQSNNILVAEFLLKSGKVESVNSQNLQGLTPLHFAAQNGNIEMIKLLVTFNAKFDTKAKDRKTAQDMAKEYGHDALITLLNPSYSPLHFFVTANDIELTRKLLEKSTSHINSQDAQGLTPLHIAIQSGKTDMVDLLVASNAKFDIKTKSGKTAQDMAKKHKHDNLAELLNPSYTPLHFFVAANDIELTRKFLEKSTSYIKAQDAQGLTPLHIASQKGNAQMVDLLLEYNARPLAKTKKSDGKVTAYGLASSSGDNATAQQIKQQIQAVAYPLNHAAKNNDIEAVRQFLTNFKEYVILADLKVTEDPVNKRDEDGYVALHYAAQNGNNKIVMLLILRGASLKIKSDENKTGDSSKTAQEIAREHGHHELALCLKPSFKPLHFAVASNNLELVEDLLQANEHKAHINMQDADGFSPLHLAVQNKNIEMVKLLLGNKAKTSLKSNAGKTAYRLAIETEEIEISKQIKALAFPLHYSVETNDFKVVRSIPTNGSINKLDEDGFAPLHIAAKHNVDKSKSIIILLAIRGTKFDIKSQDGKTAQDIAREHGHNKLADLLDPSYTILHFAVALNDAKLVEHLLSQANYQAKIATPDSKGFTPFHIAGKNLAAAQEKKNSDAIDNATKILKLINENTDEGKSVARRLKSAAPGFRESIHLGKVGKGVKKDVKSLIKKGGGSIGKMFKAKGKKG